MVSGDFTQFAPFGSKNVHVAQTFTLDASLKNAITFQGSPGEVLNVLVGLAGAEAIFRIGGSPSQGPVLQIDGRDSFINEMLQLHRLFAPGFESGDFGGQLWRGLEGVELEASPFRKEPKRLGESAVVKSLDKPEHVASGAATVTAEYFLPRANSKGWRFVGVKRAASNEVRSGASKLDLFAYNPTMSADSRTRSMISAGIMGARSLLPHGGARFHPRG